MTTNLAPSPAPRNPLAARGGATRAARLALALAAAVAGSATDIACTQATHVVGDVGGAGGSGQGAPGSGGSSGQAGAGTAGRGAGTGGIGTGGVGTGGAGTGGTGTGGAAGGKSGTGGSSGGSGAGGRVGGGGSGGKSSGGAGGVAGAGGTTASGGASGAGGAPGTGGAAGAACPPALPPASSACDLAQKGLVCAYQGPHCVDARACNCVMEAGMTGPCAWYPGATAVSCPVDGGADAGDGSAPRTTIDYTGCDLGTDIERIAVSRVDREAGTCIYMLFTRGPGVCSGMKALQSGDWCLNASFSQDVASCDQHKAPSNAADATSMTGNFTFAASAGTFTYGMDVTLQFPISGIPEAGRIRVLAQACHATCTAEQCDTGSYAP